MKVIYLLPVLFFCLTIKAQKLVTYNGAFDDGRLQNGNATYTYYEDPDSREYIKQGSFKYVFKGVEGYTGFDQIISGNFKSGLKNGLWSYTINMKDFGANNSYSTGSVTLQANYKDGYAHGKWVEVISYKKRSKVLTRTGYAWGTWSQLQTSTIEMNFDEGYFSGIVTINDGFKNIKVNGKYDNESYADGTWMITSPSGSKEYVYKDKCYYQFLERDNKGQIVPQYMGYENGASQYQGIIKFEKEYELVKKALSYSEAERIDNGYSFIDNTSWATTNIKDYTNSLLENQYFLYKYIGGDLSYEKGFMGGVQLNAEQKEYFPISNIPLYKEGEKALATKNYIDALNKYSKLDNDMIKPSDSKLLQQKIKDTKILADNQIVTYINDKEFYESYINDKSSVFQKGFDSVISKFVLQLNIFSKYTIDRDASGAQATVLEKPDITSRRIKNLEWGSIFYARPLLSNPNFYEYSLDGNKISGFVWSRQIAESYDDRVSEIISEMLRKEKDNYKKDNYFELKDYRIEVLNSLNTLEGKKKFLVKIMQYDEPNVNKVKNNLEECRKYGVLTDLQIKFIESSLIYKNFLTEKILLLQKNKVEVNYPSKGRLQIYKIERTEFLDQFDESTTRFEAAMALMGN